MTPRSLLEGHNLTKVFPNRTMAAVSEVSVAVGPNEAVGIVGESGSGKSTLARMLVGLETPTSGTVSVNGSSWGSIPRRSAQRRQVQMIFQDPYRSLNPRLTARQAVAEVLRFWDSVSRGSAASGAAELLGEVGMSGAVIDKRPGQMSGGQRQRVGIARTLAARPTVLVADEPTASLDVSVQAQILNLMLELRIQRGLSLVLVSHDLAVIRHMTERVLVMRRGCVVESGGVDQIFRAPATMYAERLIASIPGRREAGPDRVAGDCD